MAPEAPSTKSKSEVIQMRLESSQLAQVSALAAARDIPVSAMVRDWVLDRLKTELVKSSSERELWRMERLKKLETLIQDEFADGPILVVHGQPLTPNLKSNLDSLQAISTSLVPLFGMQPVTGRINRLGYQATVSHHEKLVQMGQAFKTAQVESVHLLEHKGPEIFGLMLDEAVVVIVRSLLGLLSAQQFALPFVFSISLLRVKGSWLVTQPSPFGPIPHVDFQEDKMTLPDILITDYDQAKDYKVLARHVRPILDEIWNASGLKTSFSFAEDGTWHGPWR